MNLLTVVIGAIVGTAIILLTLLAQVLEWRDRLEKYPTLKKIVEAKVLRVVLLVFAIGLLAGVLEEINQVREALDKPPAVQKPPLQISIESLCGDSGAAGKAKPNKAGTPQTVINAPNGFGITGGNVTNPTVNNFAPPERHLDTQQVVQLTAFAATLPDTSSYLVFEDVTDKEAQQYAYQIWKIFDSQGKAARLGEGLSWGGQPMPEGIYVLIHDQADGRYPIAQKIVDNLKRSGVSIKEFSEANYVPSGQIRIVIGTRPAS